MPDSLSGMTSTNEREPRTFWQAVLTGWTIVTAIVYFLWVPVQIVMHRHDLGLSALVYLEIAVRFVLGFVLLWSAVASWRGNDRARFVMVALMTLHFSWTIILSGRALVSGLVDSIGQGARARTQWQIFYSAFGILWYVSAFLRPWPNRANRRPSSRTLPSGPPTGQP